MSKEITDAMLDEQVQKLTTERYLAPDIPYGGRAGEAWLEGHEAATRAALEVEREALVVIEGLMSTLRIVDQGYEAPIVTSVLTRLRTRLGITE